MSSIVLNSSADIAWTFGISGSDVSFAKIGSVEFVVLLSVFRFNPTPVS